jgi:hypothetical protein
MKFDVLSLVSGAVVTGLGAVVLIDSSGAVDLPLGWVVVVVTAALGVVMLIGGMVGGNANGHD